MKPGIHTLSADLYHQDPADQPSLSSSIAHILCTSSPAHARTAHPRLNPDYQRTPDDKFDVGTVAHDVLLEGKGVVEVIDANDWRTTAAKEARDAARAAGKVPLLAKHEKAVNTMVASAREQLAAIDTDPPLFDEGEAEKTLVWEDVGGVICRARLDWLRHDRVTIDDFKTTGASANPERWTRTLFGIGADIQAAFYIRGVETLTGATPLFRWVVQETSPPYALSVISPAPDTLMLARKKVQYAIDLWRRCLRDDDWPGYPGYVAYANVPPWEESRWIEKETREAA